MNPNPKKVRLTVKDWLISFVLSVAGIVLFYMLLITDSIPWYFMLLGAAEGTFWARFLISGVPVCVGSLAGTLYLNAVRKQREKTAREDEER